MTVPSDTPEPRARARRTPPPKGAVAALLVGCVGAIVVPWLLVRNEPPAGVYSEKVKGAVADLKGPGEVVWQRSCVGCHDARGGEATGYPPLARSPWLVDDAETPIRILLAGVSGPLEVQGSTYTGVMPNFGVTLTDEQIAAVLTYARASWGNHAPPITEEQVAAERRALGNRPPFAGGAALVEARKAR